MLSAPDSDLVRRDPAIPGLAIVLDADAFIEKLRTKLREAARIERGEITYIRYKPGTNCLVAYRFELAGREVEAHAIAYRTDLREKLSKASERSYVPGSLGSGGAVFADHGIVMSSFPNDSRLRALRRLVDPRARRDLLCKLIPNRPELWEGRIERLRYKPNRRFVARLLTAGGAQAALKVYARQDYPGALVNSRALESCPGVRTPRLIGYSDRRRILAFEWLSGRGLGDVIADAEQQYETLARTGAALAQLHAQTLPGLPALTRCMEAKALTDVATGIGEIVPRLAGRAQKLAKQLGDRLFEAPVLDCPVHGDFYASQVLPAEGQTAFLDFDRAARGDPAADLGNFIAHLERGVLRGDLSASQIEPLKSALLEGYRNATQDPLPARIDLYTAAGLLRLAPEPFRHRAAGDPDWPACTEAILSGAEAILKNSCTRQSGIEDDPVRCDPAVPARHPGGSRGGIQCLHGHIAGYDDVVVDDPFDVTRDPKMDFLRAALDPRKVQREVRALPHLTGNGGQVRLCAIRVTRYKPGRRCLVEYDLEVKRPHAPAESMTLIGKARARGLDQATFRLFVSLWNNGFSASSADGISVPEPVGVIADFRMWLQRKVPGSMATRLLPGPGGCALAARIAPAIHKLHRSDIKPHRRHTMADELGILRQRLAIVASMERPQWRHRLERLLNACERLGAAIPLNAPCGIHRDFYSDQLLVDGARLYLLDLDLYCEGDPGLDIGNFLGHLTEQSLRTMGNPEAMAEQEKSLEERFIALSGMVMRDSVHGYKTLTLVRHIHISTLFPDRRAFTEQLLELCEQRVFATLKHRTPSKLGSASWRLS